MRDNDVSEHSRDDHVDPRDLRPEEAALATRPLADLTAEELDRWRFACLRLSKLAPSRFGRWRWRRHWRRASDAWLRCIAARVDQGPPLCERCGTRHPTVHVLYGHGAEERARHFCAACSEVEPAGWVVRTGSGA